MRFAYVQLVRAQQRTHSALSFSQLRRFEELDDFVVHSALSFSQLRRFEELEDFFVHNALNCL